MLDVRKILNLDVQPESSSDHFQIRIRIRPEHSDPLSQPRFCVVNPYHVNKAPDPVYSFDSYWILDFYKRIRILLLSFPNPEKG